MVGSAKGGKKLSKAEKEKQLKEEAEKKAKEDEEDKLRQEEQSKENKEREKAEAAERRRLEQEERKERSSQLEHLTGLIETHTAVTQNIHNERRKAAKWERYMLCDGSPNPSIPGEINTYMNLWRENTDRANIKDVLDDSHLVLSLINELDFILDDTPPEDILCSEVTQYKNTKLELQKLLQYKLDISAHKILLLATDRASTETLNFEWVEGNDTITLCLWANLCKNPRIKSFEFKEQGFNFEIPKLLTLSDVTYEILFTKFDHLSHLCKSYTPRVKQKIVEEVTVVEEEKKDEEGTDKDKDEEQPEIEREETEDVMAALRGLNEDKEETKEQVKEEEIEEELPPADTDMKTPEPVEYEEFDGDEDIVDLRSYTPLGSIIHFRLLTLPPQPKHVNSWVMTELVDCDLKEEWYIADSVNPEAINEKEKAEKEKNGGDEETKKKEERPSIGVTIRLPKDVCFFEEPQMGRWDDEHSHWKTDGFIDISYNEENRFISFKTAYFGTLALFQDKHVNMPFQSWEIRPRGTNSAVLTIIAAIVELQIEIKDNLCCLTQLDKPELSGILNKWMTVPDLVKTMQAAGINVFPDPDSSKYCDTTAKNPLTEDNLYQQMALTASCMAFTRSQWNANVNDKNRIVIQATECLKDEPPLEEDWNLYSVSKMRSIKLKMTEFDENFSEEHAEGSSFFADMYHMVNDVVSVEGRKRIKETSYKFYDSLYSLLSLTKPVTYS